MGVQINSVRFLKDCSSCCEWFIVTADFDERKIKSVNNIQFISLWVSYKNLDFYCVWNVEFCVNQAAFAGAFLIFCFNWKKSTAEANRISKFIVTLLQLINHVENGFDVSRMEISALKTSLALAKTAKKIRRQRIRGIIRRRSESNARGTCRIIGDNSTSRFCTIESHGNDSKTRKLGALWTETERRWKAIFHLRTADSKTTEKRFFASACDWKWEVDILRQSQKEKIPRPVNRCHWPQHQHHGRTFEDLYLVGPKGSCLLWATKTWRFHYGRSVSATIDSFESCIARKTVGIRAKTWESYFYVVKVIKKYLETLKCWDVLPHPLYFPDISPSDY